MRKCLIRYGWLVLLLGTASLSADPVAGAIPAAPDAAALVSATGDLAVTPASEFGPVAKESPVFAGSGPGLSPLWVPGTTSHLVGTGEWNLDDPPLRPAADDRYGVPMGLAIFFGALLLIYYSDGYRRWYQRMFGALDQY